CIFFFSSRRRHTRSKRDWSSDVCSSYLRNQSEETFDLIEPGTAGRSEMKVESTTFLGFQPALDRSTFVGRVVVQHDMDIEIGRHFLFHLVEKLQEFFTSMTRQATADDLAVQDIEGGEQRCGSVALVVMGLAFRQAGSQWQNRSRSVQRLDLALFV